MEILQVGFDSLEDCIKAIGQNLIDKAEQIANDDLSKIHTITIHTELTPAEILNFDITKNYIATLDISKKEE